MEGTSLKSFLIACLYPRRCRYCGKVIDLRDETCADCKANEQRITGEICRFCGCEKSDCTCRNKGRYYKSVAAPFYYGGAAGKAIRLLKFGGQTEFADMLSDEMAHCFEERYKKIGVDVVSFVPAFKTKKRRKEKKPDHAELLAESTAKKLGLPCEQTLEKIFDTPPQHDLPEAKRRGNLLGAFAMTNTADIKDKTILLCDDVCTTGSTLDECAKTLLIAGANAVFCLTAAVTKKEIKK